MNVLAIGAHPDDLEAFCGGTLARFARQGDNVFMCVVTDGRGRPGGDPAQIVGIRRGEAQASADLIGAELVWLGIPDGGLSYDEDARHAFIETIRQTKPNLIITHPTQDYHPDHRATSQLVMDAAQIARTRNYESDYPPHREVMPVAFMDGEMGVNFLPEEYVDISDVFDTKIQMLMQHRSQLMPDRYDPDFVVPPNDQNPFYRMAEMMSGFRGLQCNVRYAEGFRWWRSTNRIVTHRVLP